MIIIKLLIFTLLAYVIYVLAAMVYFELKTRGDNYFSLPLAGRQKLLGQLTRHARFVRPAFEFAMKIYRPKKPPLMRYDGVTGPGMIATKKSYAATKNYRPGEEDIFVATQMKCGTTWMQQIVFEILHRGEGDLSDQGYRHMYALSPWMETSPMCSVPFERAPLVGEQRNRIIKTHMPAQLCPYSDMAKYIYVTRHPVSCFSSCYDFFKLLAGPLSPTRENVLRWYCSDDMWWTSWPDHVEGWWQRSQKYPNVLFIHYEEMKNDLRDAVSRVAEFLNFSLTEEELRKVVHKSSFEYMKEHEAHFEMHAPNVFSVTAGEGSFMKAGTIDRYRDTREEEADMIMAFCRERLNGAEYPLDKYYPGATVLKLESGYGQSAPAAS